MNVLDENIPDSQHDLLKGRRIPVRQIGRNLGRPGMKDADVIRLLHQVGRPTFFTLDGDFYKSRLRHDGYCLVHLAVEDNTVAKYVRRFLRHPLFKVKAKRLGCTIQASKAGLSVWRMHAKTETWLQWDTSNRKGSK